MPLTTNEQERCFGCQDFPPSSLTRTAYETLETLHGLTYEYLTRGRLARTTQTGKDLPGHMDTRLPNTKCYLCGHQWDGRTDPRLEENHDVACLVPRLQDALVASREALRPWRDYCREHSNA